VKTKKKEEKLMEKGEVKESVLITIINSVNSREEDEDDGELQ